MVGASLKYMIQAPPVAAAISTQTRCVSPLRVQ